MLSAVFTGIGFTSINKMIRIIMVGCNGKMGQNISQIVAEDAAAEIDNIYPFIAFIFDFIIKFHIPASLFLIFLWR